MGQGVSVGLSVPLAEELLSELAQYTLEVPTSGLAQSRWQVRKRHPVWYVHTMIHVFFLSFF